MKWLISKRRRMLTFFGSTTAIGLIWIGIVTQLFGDEIRGWLLELWETQPLLLILLVVVTVLLPTGIWIIAEMNRPNDGSTNGPGPNPEPDLAGYLQALENECNTLRLSDIDKTDAEDRHKTMRLDSVYIALDTTTQRPAPDKGQRETRPLMAIETLMPDPEQGQAPARTMLLGDPGSGKSTFVNHLTYRLAVARLNRQNAVQLQKAMPGWELGPLLPVRVILRDLATFAKLEPKLVEMPLLEAYWQDRWNKQGCAEVLPVVKRLLTAGDAILLFDGLDEVIDPDVLKRIVASIRTAAQTYGQAPVLVTCRVLDHQREPLRKIGGFPTATLAQLTDEQIDQFVTCWYAELVCSHRRSDDDATKDRNYLRGALAERPELRVLARSPLLLTVIALVQTYRGTLPDDEALLYDECIDLLLLRWRRQVNDPLGQLNLPNFGASDLLMVMARLGWTAHEQAAQRKADSSGGATGLSKDDVIDAMAETLEDYDPRRCKALAEQLFHLLREGNGLLLEQEAGTLYAFPHRTFQEFLAGYQLKGQKHYVQQALERADQPHWQKALLLMVSYQVRKDKDREKPLLLAGKLLAGEQLTRQIFAAQVLLEIGQEQARSYDRAMAAQFWTQARDALLRIATQGQPPHAPASLRAEAARVLGLLSYDRLRDVIKSDARLPMPDARLPLALVGLLNHQRDEQWRTQLAQYWCPVEAGRFWYGENEDALEQRELLHDFKIARYPTTNAEFARFIAAGGYKEQQWWTRNGWQWAQQQGLNDLYPGRIERYPQYGNPLQPAVFVNWYEAVAYCKWLTDQGQNAGWLPRNEVIRLPTALEWERAARGTKKWRYPWGNEPPPDAERVNGEETGLGVTAPIGCFPQGVAACGAHEMLGNVWEWTATRHEHDDDPKVVDEIEPNDRMRLKGFSWYNDASLMRSGGRNWVGGGWNFSGGFPSWVLSCGHLIIVFWLLVSEFWFLNPES
ncbi:MAG: SUMF1/EgtB/PvdO family nonheme iron enzyme [Chloroflexaceae bacterium]|nr:SUMF1/EgtB/PvdO family nonheme iron enzyme [Chloroflexaceae bacterium]